MVRTILSYFLESSEKPIAKGLATPLLDLEIVELACAAPEQKSKASTVILRILRIFFIVGKPSP